MCQEFGHVLGLGHTSEDGSSQKTCMDYSQDVNSQWPNAHDYDMLSSMYNHADSYNSYTLLATQTAQAGASAEACVDGGNSCSNEKGQRLGVLVHRGRFAEWYAYPEKDGTITIHHKYMVEPNHDH